MMTVVKLTDDQRDAIDSNALGVIRIEDDATSKVYLLVDQEKADQQYDRWLQEQIRIGVDEADRGEVRKWDVHEFLERMHREHAQQTAS